jgi:hypothetical protein
MGLLNWTQDEINLHKPKSSTILANWSQIDEGTKSWETHVHTTHHNPNLGGITILFPIINFVNDSRDYIKMSQIPKTPKWEF